LDFFLSHSIRLLELPLLDESSSQALSPLSHEPLVDDPLVEPLVDEPLVEPLVDEPLVEEPEVDDPLPLLPPSPPLPLPLAWALEIVMSTGVA
jgi:hypothetical protein